MVSRLAKPSRKPFWKRAKPLGGRPTKQVKPLLSPIETQRRSALERLQKKFDALRSDTPAILGMRELLEAEHRQEIRRINLEFDQKLAAELNAKAAQLERAGKLEEAGKLRARAKELLTPMRKPQ